jgi:hypothetical protein
MLVVGRDSMLLSSSITLSETSFELAFLVSLATFFALLLDPLTFEPHLGQTMSSPGFDLRRVSQAGQNRKLEKLLNLLSQT